MPHKLMHRHDHRLLGNAKPTNQLVANIWDPGNCLEVVLDALAKVFLSEKHIVGALFSHNVGLLHKANVLETLAHQAEQF